MFPQWDPWMKKFIVVMLLLILAEFLIIVNIFSEGL